MSWSFKLSRWVTWLRWISCRCVSQKWVRSNQSENTREGQKHTKTTNLHTPLIYLVWPYPHFYWHRLCTDWSNIYPRLVHCSTQEPTASRQPRWWLQNRSLKRHPILHHWWQMGNKVNHSSQPCCDFWCLNNVTIPDCMCDFSANLALFSILRLSLSQKLQQPQLKSHLIVLPR